MRQSRQNLKQEQEQLAALQKKLADTKEAIKDKIGRIHSTTTDLSRAYEDLDSAEQQRKDFNLALARGPGALRF